MSEKVIGRKKDELTEFLILGHSIENFFSHLFIMHNFSTTICSENFYILYLEEGQMAQSV